MYAPFFKKNTTLYAELGSKQQSFYQQLPSDLSENFLLFEKSGNIFHRMNMLIGLICLFSCSFSFNFLDSPSPSTTYFFISPKVSEITLSPFVLFAYGFGCLKFGHNLLLAELRIAMEQASSTVQRGFSTVNRMLIQDYTYKK